MTTKLIAIQGREEVPTFRSPRASDARFADEPEDFARLGIEPGHIEAFEDGIDGAHLRFTGNVQLERFANGELAEDVSDPGIWGMMYFGHVHR
jgi:hypothetical protein